MALVSAHRVRVPVKRLSLFAPVAGEDAPLLHGQLVEIKPKLLHNVWNRQLLAQQTLTP